MLYERMLKEQERLKDELEAIEKKLEGLPPGLLVCARNGSHYKWYRSNGHEQVYLPKAERNLAEQLAVKKYLRLLHKELEKEKNAVECYLQKHQPSPTPSEELLTKHTEYQRLLLSQMKPISQELEEWSNSSYQGNTKYPQHLTHKTKSGRFVRSKSEAIISTLLSLKQIPFRYECELQIGEAVIYPDFTIRHPKTGKVYYWEHFGRMDDSNYSKNVPVKLQLYIAQGIIPSIQLITTYETMECPFSAEDAEEIIEKYFL